MKKAIIAIIVFVVFIIIFGLGIYFLIFTTSKKMKCTSNEGNITIMYNDEKITGYNAYGIEYDLHGQKEYAKQIGIDAYLDEFATWFSENTTGSCQR